MSDLAIAVTPTRARFVPVNVLGTPVLAARLGDEVRLPMRAFCDAIGLPWEPQRKRIERDEVLREGASIMEVPSKGGVQAQVTLPLDMIPGFLFGCIASRFAPELRERVTAFRRDCFRILHAHFFPPRPAAPRSDPAIAAQESARLIMRIRREREPVVRRMHHVMLERICAAQGAPLPALLALGHDAIDPTTLATAFFEGLEALTMLGVVWNHAGRPGEVAFSLPEVLGHFRAHDIAMPASAEIAAALRENGPLVDGSVPIISNITRAPLLCWVFKDRADG